MGSVWRGDAVRLVIVLLLVGGLASAVSPLAGAQATPEPTATETMVPTVAQATDPGPPVVPTAGSDPTEVPIAGSVMSPAIDTGTPAAIMAVEAAPEVTGTITKTASTTTPTIGQPVHFTVTVAGTGASGTQLRLEDTYNDTSIMSVVGQGSPGAYAAVTSENVAISDVEYSVSGSTHVFQTPFDIQQDGAYAVTFKVTMVINQGVAEGTVATSMAQLYHGTSIASQSQSLTVIPVSQINGMIATSASTTTPRPGQTVTFTIDVWGTSASATTLYFYDLFPRPALVIAEDPPISAFREVRAQNAQVDGELGLDVLPGAYYLTGTLLVQDDFSITFEVTMQIASNVDTGTTVAIDAETQDVTGEPMYDDTLNLTVAAPALDRDGDLVSDEEDNCVDVHNPGQEDGDGDGAGDACDAAVTLTMSGRYVEPITSAPDGMVAWTLTVTNSGAYLLSSITFIDHFADNLDCDPQIAGNQPEIALLEPGGSVVCTASSTLGPDDRGGTRSNVAVVEAHAETLDETVVDLASAEVAIPANGAATVTPTAPVDPVPTSPPAEPKATPPSAAESTVTPDDPTSDAVTQLPKTGNGPASGGFGMVALLSAVALAALGLAIRSGVPRRPIS